LRPSGRLLLPLLVSSILPAAAHAFDGGAWTVSPGEWYSEVTGMRSYASSRFLVDNRNEALPNGGRFQQFEAVSYNEIGWLDNVSFALGIPFINRSERDFSGTRTISGISDFQLGLRFRLKPEQPGLIFDVGWLAPSGYNKNLDPRLGDGRQKLYGDLHVGTRLPVIPGFVQASRGFHFISEDGELYWRTRVEAAAWLGQRVLLGGRYADHLALQSANEISRLGQAYRAGPVMLVRLDDRLDLAAGAERQLFGRNVLEGTRYYVTLGFKQTKLNALQGFLGASPKP